MLAEYAYVLQIGGVVYTATDVEELHQWMVERFSSFPLFERRGEEDDPIIPMLSQCTEEGKKVARAGGQVFIACFRRVKDPRDTDS